MDASAASPRMKKGPQPEGHGPAHDRRVSSYVGVVERRREVAPHLEEHPLHRRHEEVEVDERPPPEPSVIESSASEKMRHVWAHWSMMDAARVLAPSLPSGWSNMSSSSKGIGCSVFIYATPSTSASGILRCEAQ